MKDLINIFFMAVVVLGWAMLEVTDWQGGIALC